MLTPWKALLLPLASALAFCLVGALIGASIGVVAPSYYRAVVRNGDSATFDPLQVGVGLGATQGATAGALLGIVLLAILAWRDVRRFSRGGEASSATDGPVPRRVLVWLHWILGVTSVVTLLIICSGISLFIGGIAEHSRIDRRRADERVERINGILAGGNYGLVEVRRGCGGDVYLDGDIGSEDARVELEACLTREFGEEEAKRMVRTVDVLTN